ncbi:MAG: hypothetical protein HY303_11245, partial [Candidatus Wallbacteria bacterium]|nr:hypothetical protein [Candidatus Wallbacteria bacterium]
TDENNQAVRLLFGAISESREGREPGRRGLVRVSDVHIEDEPGKDCVLHHVSLDRFTGGALDGFLFTERARIGDELLVVVEVDTRRTALSEPLADALAAGLRDLAEGRLQIGAGSGRGNGYMEVRPGGVHAWPEQLGARPKEVATS